MTLVDSCDAPSAVVGSHALPPSMVERMTLILDVIDGPGARLTLQEVARRTRLPRSTVHRILDQLVRLGWVEHLDLGYCLGGRARRLGGSDNRHGLIRAAAAPLLHELHMHTGLVVHLAVLERGESLYLDKVGGRFAATLPSRVGGRVPAHTTAGGKAMLAWLDPEEVDRLCGRFPTRTTDRTITELPLLHQDLNRIRQRHGIAYERGEAVSGIGCVGVAVRGPDGPVAAVSLCGEVRSVRLEHVAPLVLTATRAVSDALYAESR
ncbi:IclR family transcriptional regulator [Nocardia macrotermitis]|uniref:Transcriptional repressor IclR n=1 Tax=Nocardia macrotermitis TaxID=2585198 RepID=A0A7K0DER5_9NOCA|nr:IclR family transcriptional regulator [Nocardia macrotermitis]MQY24207.1 Transcriptional repressor IclR [Nocardia macrotermitis]